MGYAIMNSSLDVFRLLGITRRKKDEINKKYSTFNRRMLAASVDLFLMMIFIAPLIESAFNHVYGPLPQPLRSYNPHATPQEIHQALVDMLSNRAFQRHWLADTAAQMGVLLLLDGLCWRIWSATPGKMLFGLTIVDASSEAKLSNGQIVRRLLGYGVSFVGLFGGFIWIAFDKRRQGWHDKLAHSIVVVQPWRVNPLYGSLYKAFQLLIGQVSRYHQQRDK